MENEVAQAEHKTRGVTKQANEEEKKFIEQHQNIVNVKDRCRKMTEIINFRVNEYKKVKDIVRPRDVRELEL